MVVREPTGGEDLLLVESLLDEINTALALVTRLAKPADGTACNWEGLSVTDLDALVLHVRRVLLGDRVRTDLRCPAAGCGERFDLAFGISEYLSHEQSR